MKNQRPRGFAYSACLLSLSLTTLMLQAQTVPSITGINPATAAAGASVIITGNNFSSTISDNVVWFGGVEGTVTSASTNSLTVTVPPAAGTQVRVYNQGLMGESPVQFNLSFAGTESLSSSSFNSFTPTQNFVIQNGSYNGFGTNSLGNLKFADLDGDGKPDLINGRIGVYIQHNISTPGTISAGTYDGSNLVGASFEARYYSNTVQGLFSELTSYQTNAAQEGDIDVADVDGDGKLDVVSCVYRPSNTDRVAIFRNISSGSGTLSEANFAAPVNYGTGGNWARRVRLGDFDNDGKPDILVSTSGGGGAVFHNASSPGSISFDPIALLGLGIVEDFIELADIDNDGKLDIVSRPYGSTSIRVFHNTSSGAGNISFSAAQTFTVANGGKGFRLGDLDGDGAVDVLVTGNSGVLSVLRNTSTSGTVSFDSYYSINTGTANIADAAMGDLDGDGLIDIAFNNDGEYTMYVIKNISSPGTLSFDPAAALNDGSHNLSQYTSEVVIQDIDGDGRNDIASLSTYTNGINFFTNTTTTLPVRWAGFNAYLQSGHVVLEWSTASEQNSKSFTVQRHADKGWENIAQLPAAGNSTHSNWYKYEDAQSLSGTIQYRIMQKDLDDKVYYSSIRSVTLPSVAPAFVVVSNPVQNGQIQLRLSKAATVSIFNSNGQLLSKLLLHAGLNQLTVGNLSGGAYWLKCGTELQKILIVQ